MATPDTVDVVQKQHLIPDLSIKDLLSAIPYVCNFTLCCTVTNPGNFPVRTASSARPLDRLRICQYPFIMEKNDRYSLS
jgi:hypothetical protein